MAANGNAVEETNETNDPRLSPTIMKQTTTKQMAMKRMSHSAGPWLLTLYPFLLLWFILGVPATTGAFAPPAFQFFTLAVSVLTIGLTVYWLFLAFRPARPDGWWRPRRRDWIVACIVWIAGIAGLVRLVNRVLEQTRAVNIANRGANTVWALQKRVKTHAMLASLGCETNLPPPRLGPIPREWQSANDWFASLLADGSLREGSSYDIFVGEVGGPELAAGDAELATNRCLWNCLAGIDGCPSDDTPFLWSANLGGVVPEDFAGADPARPRAWKDRVDRKRLPCFGQNVVVIRKSGQMDIRPANELTDSWFLGTSSNDPARLQVLPARP